MKSKSTKDWDTFVKQVKGWLSTIVLTMIVMTAFTQQVVAGNRGGAQAVLFPRWNSVSVDNLIGAVNETLPIEFELSQCPFFGDYKPNTTRFLKNVNSSVKVVGTFFISFHTDNFTQSLDSSLTWRSQDLNSFLITPRADLGGKSPIQKMSALVLSPQLEDQWDDNVWKAKMMIVLNQLDENQILRSGKLNLRRSPINQSTALNQTIFSYTRGVNTYSFYIRAEKHGFSNIPPSGSWSNDGDFVYYPYTINGITEDVNSAYDSSGAISSRQPLSVFINSARNRSGASTLWRPSMNLWTRSVSGGKVKWVRDASLPAPWNRTDSLISFDSREKQVMKDFLNGIK